MICGRIFTRFSNMKDVKTITVILIRRWNNLVLFKLFLSLQ
jgi:hypothetical protein